jgi:pilus assembly protein FimV
LPPPPAPEEGLPLPLIGGGAAVVIAALVGFLFWRRSASAKAAAQKPAYARTAPPKFEPAAPPEPVPESEPAAETAEASQAAEPAHDDTTTLTQEVSPESTDEPSITIDQAPSGAKSNEIDFDITSQIEAQTVPISLEANDPISEADFHLAYGLYDEAILLLKEAMQKDPARSELRVKLAETYFAAGRPLEFQEAAEPLKGKIAAPEWQKLAIMGRQICPDSPIFHEDAQSSTDASALDFAFSDEPAAAPAAAPAPSAFTPGENVIDFDADALSTGRPKSLVGDMAAPSESTPPSDIDLSQFDLSSEPADEHGERPAAPKAAPAAEGSVEFNLDELDLGKPNAFMPSKPEAPDAEGSVDFGDEVSTKLDLARAYVDMGDNEAARSLLNEVIGGGNSAQKQEAETLLKRLSA